MKATIRVLVVDDSAILRRVISDVIDEAPGIEVIGTARDGDEALVKVERLQPDLVTLDVQMPRMDGLTTLKKILEQSPSRVIMVSALTQRDADVTLQALELGALDYVAKPESVNRGMTSFGEELVAKIRAMAGTDVQRVLRVRRQRTARMQRSQIAAATSVAGSDASTATAYQRCCIALGISTGGPPALSGLFPTLRPPLPAIVVVQHMPANFTGSFARRLDSISELSVKEAENGDVLRPNTALLAPGGKHLKLRRRGGQVVAHISDDEPVSGHKPSVDVMMTDAAEIFGQRCLGIIMTGMGCDGAAGCGKIRAAGGYVLGQDEATSDVYGMNKVAQQQGNVDRQFALEDAADLLPRQCKRMFKLEPSAQTPVAH